MPGLALPLPAVTGLVLEPARGREAPALALDVPGPMAGFPLTAGSTTPTMLLTDTYSGLSRAMKRGKANCDHGTEWSGSALSYCFIREETIRPMCLYKAEIFAHVGASNRGGKYGPGVTPSDAETEVPSDHTSLYTYTSFL